MADVDVVHLVRFFFVSRFSLSLVSLYGWEHRGGEEKKKKLREILTIGLRWYIALIAAHGLSCMNRWICAAA